MRTRSLQRKRRPAKGSVFVFHSKTRRRMKQRVAAGAAAGADLGSEVPNLGVARALFVILVLHVAAIAAIFIHNKVTNDDPVVRKAAVQDEDAAAAPKPRAVPQAEAGEDFYFVATGDSYERIARLKGVDVAALRQLNRDVSLRAGKILRIPAAGAPAAVAPVAGSATASAAAVAPERNPAAPVAVAESPPEPVRASGPKEGETPGAGRAVIVEEAPSTPPAVLVKPRIHPGAAGGRTHTVSKGDTVWGIANKYKVSQKKLLEANNIRDPRKLRLGMKLTVPGGN